MNVDMERVATLIQVRIAEYERQRKKKIKCLRISANTLKNFLGVNCITYEMQNAFYAVMRERNWIVFEDEGEYFFFNIETCNTWVKTALSTEPE